MITWGEISNFQSYDVHEDAAANGVPVALDASTRYYRVNAVNACGIGP